MATALGIVNDRLDEVLKVMRENAGHPFYSCSGGFI